MKCRYCEHEIELDEEYWNFEDGKLVCEMCLDDYFDELKDEAKKVNNEYLLMREDEALERFREKR